MLDILIWLAILPSGVLIYRVLKLDKVEEEPPGLLLKVFLLGALSCIPAAILETVGETVIANIARDELMYAFGMFMLVVPFSEEGVKYLAMRSVHKRPEFNYTFDGIVYGVMASLGFATLENVLYVVGLFDVGVAFARAILSVPLHCVCGVFMGYYYGMAHRYKALGQDSSATANRVFALVVPALIHGLYDFAMSVDDAQISIAGLVFTLAIFVLAIRRTRLSADQDEAFWGGYQQ
ncbi:MAG: PrsW family intramembrane metalloprotease [Atopobiaceae bacterium]|nr:PrsW family intramembrane metalloprotease [Atopobiaceae bacterium]